MQYKVIDALTTVMWYNKLAMIRLNFAEKNNGNVTNFMRYNALWRANLDSFVFARWQH